MSAHATWKGRERGVLGMARSLVSAHSVSPGWASFAVRPQELRVVPLSSRASTLHGAGRPPGSAVARSRRAMAALRNSGRKSRGATAALRDFRSGSRGATAAPRDPGTKSHWATVALRDPEGGSRWAAAALRDPGRGSGRAAMAQRDPASEFGRAEAAL